MVCSLSIFGWGIGGTSYNSLVPRLEWNGFKLLVACWLIGCLLVGSKLSIRKIFPCSVIGAHGWPNFVGPLVTCAAPFWGKTWKVFLPARQEIGPCLLLGWRGPNLQLDASGDQLRWVKSFKSWWVLQPPKLETSSKYGVCVYISISKIYINVFVISLSMCAFFLVVDWVLYFDTETRGPDCRHFLAGVLSPGMEATAGIRGCVLDSAGIVGSRTHELLGSLMHLVHSVYGNWFRAPRHWEETPNCNSELNMNKLGRTAPPILGYTWHFSSLQPERCFSWSRKDHKVY